MGQLKLFIVLGHIKGRDKELSKIQGTGEYTHIRHLDRYMGNKLSWYKSQFPFLLHFH